MRDQVKVTYNNFFVISHDFKKYDIRLNNNF